MISRIPPPENRGNKFAKSDKFKGMVDIPMPAAASSDLQVLNLSKTKGEKKNRTSSTSTYYVL
jgi:hypothetical protein